MNSSTNTSPGNDPQLLTNTPSIISYLEEITKNGSEIVIKVPFQLSLASEDRKKVLLLLDEKLTTLETRWNEIQGEEWTNENEAEETRIAQIKRILSHIGQEVGHDEDSFGYATGFRSETCKALLELWNQDKKMKEFREKEEKEGPGRAAKSEALNKEQLEKLRSWAEASQETIEIADFEKDFLHLLKMRGPNFTELPLWRVNVWKLFTKIMKRQDFTSVLLPKITFILGALFTINEHFDVDIFREIFAQPNLPFFLAQTLYKEMYTKHIVSPEQIFDAKLWDILKPLKDKLVVDQGEGIWPRYIDHNIFWGQ